jgi:RimJ/RimL family protein N-acetyltransferase
LKGVDIRVETPFPAAAWPRVWQWVSDFRSRVADDFAPKTLEDFVAQQLASSGRTWATYRDGELCGMVSFEPVSPVSGLTHCLFRKDFWGRNTTREALRLVYTEIFAGGCHKVFGTPFRDNNAMISLARSIGFQREGVLREQTKRGGVFVDMVVLGMTKGDFEKWAS